MAEPYRESYLTFVNSGAPIDRTSERLSNQEFNDIPSTPTETNMMPLVPKKPAMPEIRSIPAFTIDEEAYLVREMPVAPWKRMTRSEIEKRYPGLL